MPVRIYFGALHPAVRNFAPWWDGETPPTATECAPREGWGGIVVRTDDDLEPHADALKTYLSETAISWLNSMVTEAGYRHYWLQQLQTSSCPGYLLLIEQLLRTIAPPDEHTCVLEEISRRKDEVAQYVARVNAARGGLLPHVQWPLT
jgi:hypothetical protein